MMMNEGRLIDQLRDQVRDPKNRLEVHGMVYRFNGFPIYADEDGPGELEQVGEITEPLWDWENDLTGDDRHYFWLMVEAIQRGLKLYGTDHWREYFTHPRIMHTLIDEYGVKCWHYPPHRLPQFAEVPPFECLVCQSYIFPKDPTPEEIAIFRNRDKLTAQDYHLEERK
jgi:hypothetical protein